MEQTINWLNLAGTILGFVSAIILSVDTIGQQHSKNLFATLKKVETEAGEPGQFGLPPIVLVVGLPLALILVGLLIYDPPQDVSWATGATSVFAFSFISWILAFMAMVVLFLVAQFFGALIWLSDKKHAGWLGFSLLAASFLLQVAADGIDAFNVTTFG